MFLRSLVFNSGMALILLVLVFSRAAVRAEITTTGNYDRGERIYQRCIACHSLTRNRTGPKHCGLLGRRAGSLPGFSYSAAMKNSGIVWNRATLSTFLSAPLDMIPGTKMGYFGIKRQQDREDLIEFLARVNTDPQRCPE